MFDESAAFYDAIYAFKDYAAEAGWLRSLLTEHGHPDGEMLDVACGTGAHLLHLRRHYQVEGLDLDAGMLAAARARLPDVPLHRADMLDFELGRTFDAVVCLFSSIGYMRTVGRMQQAVATMARHVRAPGGVLAIEPWFTPAQWRPGVLHALLVDEPELKVARLSRSEPAVGGLSVLEFHYLIGDASGVRHVTERHELGLFEAQDYRRAFESAGLRPQFDADGPSGRGLYFAVRQGQV